MENKPDKEINSGAILYRYLRRRDLLQRGETPKSVYEQFWFFLGSPQMMITSRTQYRTYLKKFLDWRSGKPPFEELKWKPGK